MPVVGPTKTYRQTTSTEAEMAKYMENIFYAMKITFCYEMNEICRAINVDYNEVRELWLLDPRINPMHTAVFKDNDYPFSGKCLPKDTAALVELSKNAGYNSKLIKEVLKSNDRIEKIRKSRKN
jgi:UDP-glucose 6-dehydrogenase